MKILVIGASGLLGSNILYYLEKKNCNVYYTIHKNKVQFRGTRIIANLLENFENIEKYTYDIVINTIALTNVDLCEKEQLVAYKINVEIPKKIALFCKKTNSRLIHISSDQIFNGKQHIYTEKSDPHPLNTYGKTKLESEKVIQRILDKDKYMILRTNFFGINCLEKLSFSEWILDSLKFKREINMFCDVFFNPLLVNSVVHIIYQSIQKKLYGVYNCTSDNCISKYVFGKLLRKEFALKHQIGKVTIRQKLSTKRPKNMCLDNSKLKNALQINSLPIEEELTKLHDLYRNGYHQDLKKHYEN